MNGLQSNYYKLISTLSREVCSQPHGRHSSHFRPLQQSCMHHFSRPEKFNAGDIFVFVRSINWLLEAKKADCVQ